jgi:hypothetical protein
LRTFQSRCRADVSVSVFRPRRLQYETVTDLAHCDTIPRTPSPISAGVIRAAFLAIVLLCVFDGQTTSLDPWIDNFGLLRTVRYFTSMVYQKFVQKLRTMATAEVALKSPSIPLFQRGNFPRMLFPLFGKACPERSRREGEGEIFGGTERELCGEL